MENASKALIMAGAVLISILIFSLMFTLFLNAKEVFGNYEDIKNIEVIQQFNVNFTKYLGSDLNIYQVLTIYNFAIDNDVTVNTNYSINNIKDNNSETYTLQIRSYSADGYIKEISIIKK